MSARPASATLLAAMLLAAGLLAGTGSPARAEDAAEGAAAAELPVPADKSAIVMNFEEVDLTAFVRFISKVTGRNIVFSDKVEGTVSVVSPTPVNVEQAFAMFQSVLATQGLTTVDEGAVLRIVPTKEARTAGSTVVDSGKGAAGFSTRLIPLRYVSASDIARVLTPQVSKDGSIVPYEGTNTVIVSDTTSNLARLDEMVKAMDIPGHEQQVAVIHLRHAEAVRTSEQIVEILLGQSGREGRRRGGDKADDRKDAGGTQLQMGFKISPDERTNSLIVMAPAAEMERVRALAAGLDTEVPDGEERVHVYYARNADAESLVEVVSGMLLGSKAPGMRKSRKGRDDQPAAQPASQGLASSSPPPSASDQVVSITADPATNAVIVDGPNQEWRTIEGLLKKLDIQRPQVFIEAIIIEASANKAKALGFDYQGAIDIGAGDILMRSNIAQLGSAFINPLALGGMVAAAASDKQVSLPDGTKMPANYALLQAINATNDIEVLSAPTLLTLDNQQAEITVGQNIPFVSGRTTDITNISNIFTQVERKDVGIKLKVRPQVAEGDVVVLEVEQEVSALVRTNVSEAQQVALGPTTTIRSASTAVSVGDGRTVVIGGLISNRLEDTDQKVPLLGDIPGIGRLFQYRRKDKEKVNLIVFLTPHVIRTPKDLDWVSGGQRDAFRGQMRDRQSALPGDPAPAAAPAASVPASTGAAPAKAQPAGKPSAAARPPAAAATASAPDAATKPYPFDKDARARAPF